jgi:coenzyme F420-reducing hydrogenase beta subunit
MGKATRSLSGASQKKYFRDLFQSADGVTAEGAEVLTDICEREIAQVRVRLPIPERGRKNRAAKAKVADPVAAAASAVSDSTQSGFDPFAFSVVVVVTKEGREGLARKLEAIASPDDLRQLAKAQHVALPDGSPTIDGLRAAIIEGALQRVANRKAAAS